MSRFDHPDHTLNREVQMVRESAASATDFAIFRSRRKALVKKVVIVPESVGSATDTFIVYREGASAGTVGSISSTTTMSVGTAGGTLPSTYTLTLASSQTLTSVGESMVLRHSNTGGVYSVIWEYQILPD